MAKTQCFQEQTHFVPPTTHLSYVVKSVDLQTFEVKIHGILANHKDASKLCDSVCERLRGKEDDWEHITVGDTGPQYDIFHAFQSCETRIITRLYRIGIFQEAYEITQK